MITLTREEAQQVLDALEQWNTPLYKRGTAIKTLRQAIAEAEKQEPVAWHEPGAYGNVTVYKEWAKENGWLPLYTAPPQRKWQGLTDEEIADMHHEIKVKGMGAYKTEDIYRAIEAKLKEKNSA